MKYQRPEIVAVTPALSGIQGSTMKGAPAHDGSPVNATSNAYEADE